MSKVLRNTTGSDINLSKLGVTISSGTSFIVPTGDYLILSSPSSITELTSLINSGSIIVNNGVSDITDTTKAINYLYYPDSAKSTIFDNSTNSFSSTEVQSAIEESKNTALALAPIYYETKTSTPSSTTSATFSTVTNSSVTVNIAGDYLVVWDAEVNLGDLNGQAEFAVFIDDVQEINLTHISELNVALLLGAIGTSRMREGGSHITGKITVAAGKVVDIRFRNIGGSTITVNRRALTLIRIFDPALIGSASLGNISHASRHLPNGTDPLATGVPSTLNPDIANTEGTANAFARADHIHNIPAAAPDALVADGGNIEGNSTSFARADHKHDMPTTAPQSTGTANSEGTSESFVRADHIHDTTIANQSVNATAAANTTSNTAVVLTSMTLTVAVSGTYLIKGNVVFVSAGNNTTTIGLYRAGILLTNTNGTFARNANNPMTYAGFTIASLTAGQTIDIRWNTSGGTQITANLRSLAIIRLGA